MRRCLSIISAAVMLMLAITVAHAQGSIAATDDRATIDFPNSLTFSVHLKSDTPINQVVLEYGSDQLTCGKVVAEAFPDITPGKELDVTWAWEMKQSGSQPPGSHIWWRWRVTDANAHESVTEQQSIVWLDQQHPWQTVTGNLLNLHWYSGGQSFGPELHDSAVQSLSDLAKSTGLKLDSPADLYIYANTQDMRDAVLYEPGWTGGLAYPEHNIVIIGISQDQIDWGKRTEAHELTHVLVGHLTFSCLGDVPTWLNEGLAVYGEGGPEAAALQQFKNAVTSNELISARALSGGFAEDPAKADLSYSESYSLVNFLVKQYGQDKMLSLLKTLRDGATVDEALQANYGFDIDGFEDAWRASINAKPRSTANTKPTATSIPTMVPTFAPVSSAPIGPTMAPTRDRPTPMPVTVAQAPARTDQPAAPVTAPTTNTPPVDSSLVIIAVAGGVLLLGLIVFIISRRRQGMDI